MITRHTSPKENTAPPVGETIGHSEEGRPIALYRHDAGGDLRVLVFAGQHGDEHGGCQAVSRIGGGELAGELARQGVDVALLPNLNPDGAVRRTRTNARGVDLNRDHQLLSSAEVQALHRLVRDFEPHLIVDVHTYPPRRRHLLDHDLVYCHDVFVETPTNPNTGDALPPGRARELLDHVTGHIADAGFRSERYTLIRKSGQVRHGTLDVLDARNGLTLRYGIPTILLEGREPTRREGPIGVVRAANALQVGLTALLRYAAARPFLLAPRSQHPDHAVLRCRYIDTGTRCRLEFFDARTGAVRLVEWPGEFLPEIEEVSRVSLPRAYAVPRDRVELIATLERHGFTATRPAGREPYRVQEYRVVDVWPSSRPNRAPRRISLSPTQTIRPLQDFVLVAATGRDRVALAVYLEPESKFGLARFPELDLGWKAGERYPVVRVL